jgi:hypothetical protein
MSRRLFAPTAATLAVAMIAVACTQRADTSGDTTIASSTSTSGADTTAMVRGTVASASPTQLVVATSNGNDTIALTQPLQVYSRQPAKLADVKNNVFIGVTTVKQPDGSERATEIHIFPEELRGLGEGSRMMTQNGGGNRMTNGAVSNSRMTNGTASPSRMSNGNVANANGSTLDVQYAGGSQKVVVPPNTPVTQIKATSKQLATGDRVSVQAKKAANGSLSANRVMLAGR